MSGWLAVRICDLSRGGAEAEAAAAARLLPGERDAAGRIACATARRGHVAARAALRAALAAVGGAALARAPLARTASGQPVLAGGGPALSLSHAGAVAVAAVASGPVGIDLEGTRTIDPALRRRLPPPGAVDWLDAPGTLGRPDLADPLRLWTLAEARVKQAGGRLAEHLAPWRRAPGRVLAAAALAVPAGHVCTCCLADLPGRTDITCLPIP